MKKFILSLFLMAISLLSFTQDNQEKTVLINSTTLTRGGAYEVISGIAGRSIYLTRVDIKFVAKTTAYTIVGADTVTIKTQTPDGLETIAYLENSLFEKTITYPTFTDGAGYSATYGNSIILNIPAGLLTLGNTDAYFTFTYDIKD